MTYVNYNRYGQNIGHNSIVPHGIAVNGSIVTYHGNMSRKTADLANEQNLISRTVTGEYGTLHCVSPYAAQRVADLLAANQNYPRRDA